MAGRIVIGDLVVADQVGNDRIPRCMRVVVEF